MIDGHANVAQAISYPHHAADTPTGQVNLERGTAIEAFTPQLTAMGDTMQFYKDIALTSMPYGQSLAICALGEFLRTYI